jgi:hypothetical protein
MDFYFPDSQDQIDPTFDFVSEERSVFHVRQSDDLYAHEVHRENVPYNGLLVSKSIVDGMGGAGRYTAAQRHRLHRMGVRGFFRLDEVEGPRIKTLGDCGAFSYAAAEEPPYTPDEVIDFYERCGFDRGIAIDHVIFGYSEKADREGAENIEWIERHQLNFKLAKKFFERHQARNCSFDAVGVAHGYSPGSYAQSVQKLQEIGYRRIALGGMVPLKTDQILACLTRIEEAGLQPETQFHLLGVTRGENVNAFAHYKVTSFDSTTPFRQSFKDDKDNYYWRGRNYTALRVTQVEGNAKLAGLIRSGKVDQGEARRLEQDALRLVRAYDKGKASIMDVLTAIREYDEMQGRKDQSDAYRETLEDRPWQRCSCGVCSVDGVEVILFRGTERNKRRGFHNLVIFNQRLQGHLGLRRASTTTSS